MKTLTGETTRAAVPHNLPQHLARLVANFPSTDGIGCTVLTAYEPSPCHHGHNTPGCSHVQCGTILPVQTSSTVDNKDGSTLFRPQDQPCRPQDDDSLTKDHLVDSLRYLEIRWLA